MIPSPHRDPNLERERRLEMICRAAIERAGLYYRLGFSEAEAARRLGAYLDWDFEIGGGGRPAELGKAQLRELIKSTYARRPQRG